MSAVIGSVVSAFVLAVLLTALGWVGWGDQ